MVIKSARLTLNGELLVDIYFAFNETRAYYKNQEGQQLTTEKK